MIKRTLIAAVCCALIFGCDRKTNTPVTPLPANDTTKTKDSTANEDSSYVIAGITDVELTKTKFNYSILLSLAGLTGQQNRIDLSLEGLPPGVTGDFTPASGILPYTTTMYLSNNSGTAGVHNIKLKGTNEAGKTKTIVFRLTLPSYFCTEIMAQTFTHLMIYKADGTQRGTTGLIGQSDTQLDFSNLDMETRGTGMGAFPVAVNNVHATVNCNAGTITIPEAQYAASAGFGYTVSGSGTFNVAQNKFELSYTVITPENTTIKYTIK